MTRIYFYFAPILSACIYVAFGWSNTISSSVAGYIMAFLPYIGSVYLLHKHPTPTLSLGSLLACTMGACLTLLLAPPILSEDLWRYIWDGHVQNAHINPYCWPPNNSVFDAFAAENKLEGLRQRIGHSQLPTIYPPVAQLLFRVVGMFGPSSLPIRFVGILAAMIAIITLWNLIKLRGQNTSLVLLFASNPLLLIEVSVGGHIDIFGVAALLAGIYFIEQKKERLGSFLYAISVLLKLIPIIVFPIVFGRKKRLWPVVFLTILGGYLFFYDGACSPFGSLGTFGAKWRHNDGVFSVFYAAFTKLHALCNLHQLNGAPFAGLLIGSETLESAQDFGLFGAKLMSLGLLGFGLLKISRSTLSFGNKVFGCFALFFVVSPVVHPWYLIWVLPLIPLIWSKTRLLGAAPLIWWSFSVLAAYAARINLIESGIWVTPSWVLWASYIPLGILSFISIRRWAV